jgi:hypothetical protein
MMAAQKFGTNLGLAALPETDDPKLYSIAAPLHGAVRNLASSIDSLNSVISELTMGSVGRAKFWLSQNVTAGQIVSFDAVGSYDRRVRPHAAGLTLAGIALETANAGSQCTVQFKGQLAFSGVLIGHRYYSLASSPPQIVAFTAASQGLTAEYIGYGIDTDILFVDIPSFAP